MFPKSWNPVNVLDMHHWCRVLRERYKASGDRDAVERTYTMCARIRRMRGSDGQLTKLASEGFYAKPADDEEEHPYR